jgi:hypothetical protein
MTSDDVTTAGAPCVYYERDHCPGHLHIIEAPKLERDGTQSTQHLLVCDRCGAAHGRPH